MSFRKNDLFGFFIFTILVVIGLVLRQSYFTVLLAIIIYFHMGCLVKDKSSVHMMFFLGYSSFIFLPSLLNWYYLNTNFTLFFLSSFVAAFFIFLTRETVVRKFVDFGKVTKLIFLIFCLAAVVLIFTGLGSFLPGIFAFLIVLLCLCFKQGKIKNNAFYFFIFNIVFFAYVLLAWSGFGRTEAIGWLLLAVLQFGYSINFKFNKYAFGLIPGIASTMLGNRDLLNLKFSGFEEALNDSAYGPYRLASSFIDDFNKNGFDFLGFLDQILFTLFVFIPRDIWPSKPFGFGYEYTVRNLDAYLADTGHSIAATLIGEHIYFLGYFGFVTALVIFLLIALVTNLLYRIKGLNGNGVLIFSASMMVLNWGGMTSFSARIALPSIIFVLAFTLLRPFLIRKIKIKWGS